MSLFLTVLGVGLTTPHRDGERGGKSTTASRRTVNCSNQARLDRRTRKAQDQRTTDALTHDGSYPLPSRPSSSDRFFSRHVAAPSILASCFERSDHLLSGAVR